MTDDVAPDSFPKVIVYGHGLVYVSACTTHAEDGPVEDMVNIAVPTGLDHGWSVAREPFADGTPNGAPCDRLPGRRHVLLTC